MEIGYINIILYGLFYAVLISIPVFLVISFIRAAKSSTETATTTKDIKRLLEELIEVQKETNTLLKRE